MDEKSAAAFSVIGGSDGPTAIFLAGKVAPREVDADIKSIAEALNEKMSFRSEIFELDEETILNYVDLTDDTEAVMYMTSGSTADEIVLFKCNNLDDVEEMTDNLNMFLQDQINSYENYFPEEAARIEVAPIITFGNIVGVCVCENPGEAFSLICSEMGK